MRLKLKKMKIKGLKDECFQDYKKPAMYIAAASCSFKCDKDNSCTVCQNSHLAESITIFTEPEYLIERYLENPLTSAIVFSGLEPFDQIEDILDFTYLLREVYKCDDDIVIYTGYTKEELENEAEFIFNDKISYQLLKKYKNIYVKFGRYLLGYDSHYDEVLGVNLASPNQYGEKISYE